MYSQGMMSLESLEIKIITDIEASPRKCIKVEKTNDMESGLQQHDILVFKTYRVKLGKLLSFQESL